MKRQPVTRRSALQLGSLVLLLGVQHIARGATIVAVRVWPSKDYTRLTIESDGEIKAKQFFIADPPRLARTDTRRRVNECRVFEPGTSSGVTTADHDGADHSLGDGR